MEVESETFVKSYWLDSKIALDSKLELESILDSNCIDCHNSANAESSSLQLVILLLVAYTPRNDEITTN